MSWIFYIYHIKNHDLTLGVCCAVKVSKSTPTFKEFKVKQSPELTRDVCHRWNISSQSPFSKFYVTSTNQPIRLQCLNPLYMCLAAMALVVYVHIYLMMISNIIVQIRCFTPDIKLNYTLEKWIWKWTKIGWHMWRRGSPTIFSVN